MKKVLLSALLLAGTGGCVADASDTERGKEPLATADGDLESPEPDADPAPDGGDPAADSGTGCAVETFERAHGVYEDCGTLNKSTSPEGRVPPGEESSIACVADALDTCQPVRLTQVSEVPEGGVLRQDFFVVDDGGECRIHVFIDSTEANFSASIVTHRGCPPVVQDYNAGDGLVVRGRCEDYPSSSC